MEPSIQALGGEAPLRVFKRYLLATRPMFLTASVLPVIVGSSWGAMQAGQWQWLVTVIAVLDIAVIHAAVNVLNDVYDDRNGTDRDNQARIFPFTGGSRFIQNGVLSADQMRRYALALLVTGMVLGAVLTLMKGWGVLGFGLVGLALGVLYSAPPIALASRGLGELAVALGFGLLPVSGAAWLQTGKLDIAIVLLAAPASAWVANILIMNEVPDRHADAKAGKATLVVRFGLQATRWLYAALSILALLASLWLVSVSTLVVWGTLPIMMLALVSLRAAWQIPSEQNTGALVPAIQKTLMVHALGCIWFVVWPWL